MLGRIASPAGEPREEHRLSRIARRRTLVLASVVALGAGAVIPVLPVAPASPAEANSAAGLTPLTEVARYAGGSRYETAVEISKRTFPSGVESLFIVTGQDFPDAISASAPAAFLRSPVLLTKPSEIAASTLAEIRRLRPKQVFVIGGTGVVSTAVERRVRTAAQVKVTRLAGSDRYGTNRAVTDRFFPKAKEVFVATGRAFPDALAASAVAGLKGSPVVLVDGQRSSLDRATGGVLDRLRFEHANLAGGPGAVSPGIERALGQRATVARYSGVSRYETAASILGAFAEPTASGRIMLASGADFPDALSAAAASAATGIPLLITKQECMNQVTSDRARALGATSVVGIGGTAVVSRTAASGARCVPGVKPAALTDWATTGWSLDAGAAVPYSDRALVDLRTIKVDDSGLRIYQRIDNGARADHPVAYAQYGITALQQYQQTGSALWLDRAVRHAEQLERIKVVRDGAWWFPYRFPWKYYARSLSAPWWSGMAQGEALSLFVRLFEETGDARWENAAHQTWKSMLQPHASGTAPWASLVIDGHLYSEEYATRDQPPLLVLNGHVFAAFGVWDYWRMTQDEQARRVFDGMATTVLARMMPIVRVENGISLYCVQENYCSAGGWQNANYHPIHAWQLDTLQRLTADARFGEWAALLRQDSSFAAGRSDYFFAPEPGTELEPQNDDTAEWPLELLSPGFEPGIEHGAEQP